MTTIRTRLDRDKIDIDTKTEGYDAKRNRSIQLDPSTMLSSTALVVFPILDWARSHGGKAGLSWAGLGRGRGRDRSKRPYRGGGIRAGAGRGGAEIRVQVV